MVVFIGEEKIDSGIPDSEKEAAKWLLTIVFDDHDKEELLYKALDAFADVYDSDIPGWLQYLYDYLKDSGDNEYKLDVVRNFAEQNNMELIV